jgi:hypothetical protein
MERSLAQIIEGRLCLSQALDRALTVATPPHQGGFGLIPAPHAPCAPCILLKFGRQIPKFQNLDSQISAS